MKQCVAFSNNWILFRFHLWFSFSHLFFDSLFICSILVHHWLLNTCLLYLFYGFAINKMSKVGSFNDHSKLKFYAHFMKWFVELFCSTNSTKDNNNYSIVQVIGIGIRTTVPFSRRAQAIIFFFCFGNSRTMISWFRESNR